MGCSLGLQGDIGATAETIADEVYSAFVTTFVSSPAAIITGWTFEGVSVTRTTGGDPVNWEVLVPIVGTGGGESLTVNTAILVRKNTASGGRKQRGRMFVPPFNTNEGDVTAAGFLDGTYLASQNDGWADFLTSLAADDVFPWLLHTDPADAPTPITSLLVQPQVATQRRRMR